MVRVLFVCLGNICRSPMAEFILKDLVRKNSWDIDVASAGTSSEEEGNPVYPPAKAELSAHGIRCEGKRAVALEREDYCKYDYILCMESRNVVNAIRIFGADKDGKVYRLMDFSQEPKDIADPWYTRDFKKTYTEIEQGVNCFVQFLREKKKI